MSFYFHNQRLEVRTCTYPDRRFAQISSDFYKKMIFKSPSVTVLLAFILPLNKGKILPQISKISSLLYNGFCPLCLSFSFLLTSNHLQKLYIWLFWLKTLSSFIQTKIFQTLGAYGGMFERRLLNDLMEYYQKLERPVANESEAVQLKGWEISN